MHIKYMKKALELSKKGYGHVNPNPLVGCVIVKEGRVISQGYHKKYGDKHAEVNAIENAKESLTGATMYVTLEPCSHFGKTPPCVNKIIENKISKVYIAMKDPNPLVAGRGINILKDNGVEVKVGILEEEARRINEIFIKYITQRKPFCTLKSAITLDGKIATHTGDSKWISNKKSREIVHELRQKYSGILVGINTVIKDDPMLNVRLKGIKDVSHPTRIIVDSRLRIPMKSKVLNNLKEIKTVIATTKYADEEKIEKLKSIGAKVIICKDLNNRVDLKDLMDKIVDTVDSILIEGGGSIAYSALESGIVDKVDVFIAPKIFGGISSKGFIGGIGVEKVDDAFEVRDMKIRDVDGDIYLQGYL